MDTQPEGGNNVAETTKTGQRTTIDPLRRVFVPIEKRTTTGDVRFQTRDGVLYERNLLTGVIKRVIPGEADAKAYRKGLEAQRRSAGRKVTRA